jgi:dethiobiotin synthetase
LSVYFITGAGTDIGKTYVTAILIRQLRARGHGVIALKPVVSGVPATGAPGFDASDTAMLLAAQDLAVSPATVEACSPWRFAQPLSPDMAAAGEGRTVSLASVLDWCRGRIAGAADGTVALIEGVGGVMSPMTSDALNLDLIKALGCEALLVTGSYLGALTHALTAIETLKAHAVPIGAVIVNESAGSGVDFGATCESLQRYVAKTKLVTIRRGATAVSIGEPFDTDAPRGSPDCSNGRLLRR